MIAITTMLITSCNSSSENGRFQQVGGDYFDTKEGILYNRTYIENSYGNRVPVMEITDVKTGQITIKDVPDTEDKRRTK